MSCQKTPDERMAGRIEVCMAALGTVILVACTILMLIWVAS